MTLIDGDRIITAYLYDDEYELFTEKKMSIIDFIDAYTEEGVTAADDVLDRIRAEIDHVTEIHSDGEFYIKNIDVKRILDKYSTGKESEGV